MSDNTEWNIKPVKRDVNGNSRHVVSYLAFLIDADRQNQHIERIDGLKDLREIALKRARTLGGKKYRGKDFGGGIVFQMTESELRYHLSDLRRKMIANPNKY